MQAAYINVTREIQSLFSELQIIPSLFGTSRVWLIVLCPKVCWILYGASISRMLELTFFKVRQEKQKMHFVEAQCQKKSYHCLKYNHDLRYAIFWRYFNVGPSCPMLLQYTLRPQCQVCQVRFSVIDSIENLLNRRLLYFICSFSKHREMWREAQGGNQKEFCSKIRKVYPKPKKRQVAKSFFKNLESNDVKWKME